MDKFVSNIVEETQIDQDTHIHVIRLPYKNGYTYNSKIAKHFLNIFNPDWVSLQYVSYSFQNKGLPFYFSKSFNILSQGRNLHIMFHEIWVGITKDRNYKSRVIGYIQKYIIKNFIQKTNPKFISSTNKFYSLAINSLGYKNEIIPLFSNIKQFSITLEDINFFYNQINITDKESKNCILVGLFRSIHEIKFIENPLKQILENNILNKKVFLISFGRNTITEKQLLNNLVIKYANFIIYIDLGFLNELQISTILHNIDYGIASTQKLKLAKSGTFAAFKLHGVKTLYYDNNEIINYDMNDFNIWFEKYLIQENYCWGVNYISNKHIYHFLNKYSN